MCVCVPEFSVQLLSITQMYIVNLIKDFSELPVARVNRLRGYSAKIVSIQLRLFPEIYTTLKRT